MAINKKSSLKTFKKKADDAAKPQHASLFLHFLFLCKRLKLSLAYVLNPTKGKNIGLER